MPQRTLSRDQLLDLARHRAANAFDRSMDTQVSRLRKKIERDPGDPKIIKTVWGGGYIFTPRREPGMTRFLPKSLFGQTLLILLFGLVVSQLVGAWIYAGAREQAVRAIGGLRGGAARRQSLPPGRRGAGRLAFSALCRRLSDPSFHVSLSPGPPEQLPTRRRRRRESDRGLCAAAASRSSRSSGPGCRLRASRPCARRAVRSPAHLAAGRWAEWVE